MNKYVWGPRSVHQTYVSRALLRDEPVPGASRRDATRTDSSFRVVVTSRLVAPTELDSRLHPFSRGSTCRPDRVRHQTPPRRLRIRLVDPSDSWVAPCRSDKVRLVRRRVPSDRARHVRLLRLSARRVARRVRPAARLVRPPVPSARARVSSTSARPAAQALLRGSRAQPIRETFARNALAASSYPSQTRPCRTYSVLRVCTDSITRV